MMTPRVLHIDHRAAFWTRMSRNYRHRYEALQRCPAFEMCDVRGAGASLDRGDFEVLVVGVFGTPLHPQFPGDVRLPGRLLARVPKRCLVLEDMHEQTYRGGLRTLAAHINEHFQYLIATYDCAELAAICRACPKLRRVFVLPHHVDMSLFRDYGLEKRWDILIYGNLFDQWYPFRNRLCGLVSRQFQRVRVVRHPNYRTMDPRRCGAGLARIINQSRIAIATPLICDYLVAKYFEISACRCVVAGKMAAQGQPIWEGNYVRLAESMSDYEIVTALEEALDDPARLRAMSDAMMVRVPADFSLSRYVEKFSGIMQQILAD